MTPRFSARDTIRAPVYLSGNQERTLHQAAEELPLAARGRFHAAVRRKLVGGFVGEAELAAAIKVVRRAILGGIRLRGKGLR